MPCFVFTSDQVNREIYTFEPFVQIRGSSRSRKFRLYFRSTFQLYLAVWQVLGAKVDVFPENLSFPIPECCGLRIPIKKGFTIGPYGSAASRNPSSNASVIGTAFFWIGHRDPRLYKNCPTYSLANERSPQGGYRCSSRVANKEYILKI